MAVFYKIHIFTFAFYKIGKYTKQCKNTNAHLY